jgi:hypothetical protein
LKCRRLSGFGLASQAALRIFAEAAEKVRDRCALIDPVTRIDTLASTAPWPRNSVRAKRDTAQRETHTSSRKWLQQFAAAGRRRARTRARLSRRKTPHHREKSPTTRGVRALPGSLCPKEAVNHSRPQAGSAPAEAQALHSQSCREVRMPQTWVARPSETSSQSICSFRRLPVTRAECQIDEASCRRHAEQYEPQA